MFSFKGFRFDVDFSVTHFDYEIVHAGEKFNFTEKVFFDKKLINPDRVNSDEFVQALHTLYLILGVSYWKLFCPKEIVIEGFKLNKEQAEFWNKVYTKGLGEFFYKNNIDFRGLVKFPFGEDVQASKEEGPSKKTGKSLVLWGGGKDSIVTAEMLKKCQKNFDLFSLNDYPIQRSVAKISDSNLIIAKREIDPLLLKLNSRSDTYNGHVPITFVYSAVAVLTSVLYGHDNIITSCEESANYGNVDYLGETINHQWSKSYEFEEMLRDYLKKYVSKNIDYFSLIRPFHEIKIVEIFSSFPQYFSSFSSCNRNFTIGGGQDKLWCGECPKCAFVFSLLAGFLPKETIVKIFGKNLFADETLFATYEELLGSREIKPFDCVGTPEETKLAFYLAHERGEFESDFIMQKFVKTFEKDFKEISNSREVLLGKNGKVTLPAEFTKCEI